jgi:hypothetical protein
LGVFRHLLQATVDLEQSLVDLGADQELERDAPHGVHALGRHLGEAFDALELLLLLLNDFALDFLRACTTPYRFDGERGNLHLGRKLFGHPHQRNKSE